MPGYLTPENSTGIDEYLNEYLKEIILYCSYEIINVFILLTDKYSRTQASKLFSCKGPGNILSTASYTVFVTMTQHCGQHPGLLL